MARFATTGALSMLIAMELVTTRFGFSSTAADVLEGVDLVGKQAILTGGASGIGVETARALATSGASVVLAVRGAEAGSRAASDIRGTSGNDNVHVAHLDLANLSSVEAFVSTWDSPLDILVNNAGIMAVPELERTPQGHELQFGTNFLGHFALTVGLHRWLAAASTARVVSVSSSARTTFHRWSSTTWTTGIAPMTRGLRMVNRKRPASCSPLPLRGAGEMTVFGPTH